MCGICGWVGSGSAVSDNVTIRAMSEAIAHRGPDGLGSCAIGTGEHAGRLGHTRLKILDLTDAAAQPMLSDDGNVSLVYNGEIYNFAELRVELAARGHRFSSTGDTEVVLRAYEEWREDFVKRLDGMFAVAVWDAIASKLVLTRDRSGKKPLFYALTDGRLTFASEIKSLARAAWISLTPAIKRLPAFLTFGYVPGPDTFYDGIRQVSPASVLTYEPATGRCQERVYWTPLSSDSPLRATHETVAQIRGLVEQATRRRMLSDVPIGSLLSGGIDSSVVTAAMAQLSDQPVHSFAVGFTDAPSFDERSHAQEVARHLGTRHRDFVVDVDAGALLDRLVWLHDGPFADSSAIPTYLVFQAAANDVTVVLTGDGGDEVFAGYQRFAAAALAHGTAGRLDQLARVVADRLPRGDGYFNARTRLDRFLAESGSPVADRYLGWISVVDADLRDELLRSTPTPDAGASFYASLEEARDLPPVDRIIFANFKTYLPGDLHVKVDRMSMAHGVEARSPLLDTRLIELTARIAARDKVGFARPKPLLRRAFARDLPASVFRRPKHGFGVPVGQWFRGDLGERYADEVLGPGGRAREWLSRATLERLWRDHRSSTFDYGPQMWAVLTLESWLRDLARTAPLQEPGTLVVSGDLI